MNNDFSSKGGIGQLFDNELVCEIAAAYIVAYLVDTGKKKIDVNDISKFVVDNFRFIVNQVVNKEGNDANEKKSN
jgi:hypothetical protein